MMHGPILYKYYILLPFGRESGRKTSQFIIIIILEYILNRKANTKEMQLWKMGLPNH